MENPKIDNETISNLNKLANLVFDTYFTIRMGINDSDDSDVGSSLILNLFMLQDVSKAMTKIKKIGDEHKDKSITELVLMILTIVFFVPPFAGAAVQSLGGAARLATTVLIVGEADNAAMSISEIIKDSAAAPFAILTIPFGVSDIRTKGLRVSLKNAAKVRRVLKPEHTKFFWGICVQGSFCAEYCKGISCEGREVMFTSFRGRGLPLRDRRDIRRQDRVPQFWRLGREFKR